MIQRLLKSKKTDGEFCRLRPRISHCSTLFHAILREQTKAIPGRRELRQRGWPHRECPQTIAPPRLMPLPRKQGLRGFPFSMDPTSEDGRRWDEDSQFTCSSRRHGRSSTRLRSQQITIPRRRMAAAKHGCSRLWHTVRCGKLTSTRNGQCNGIRRFCSAGEGPV